MFEPSLCPNNIDENPSSLTPALVLVNLTSGNSSFIILSIFSTYLFVSSNFTPGSNSTERDIEAESERGINPVPICVNNAIEATKIRMAHNTIFTLFPKAQLRTF